MRSSEAKKGTVFLVGAGPGDPELLTMRAYHLIRTADVIFHDDLVSPEILTLAGAEALVVSVGKRCGRPRITQAGIHALLIDAVRAGQSVVRLKSGDPLIFGRAGEEIAALRGAGVPFEVVPGVTAALAAGASLSLPLTDRRFASKLLFVTGHHAAGKGGEATPVWQGSLPPDTTLVVYMPGRDLGRLQRELLDAGLPNELPCAAISQIGTGEQAWKAGELGQLGMLHPGPGALLVIVGEATRSLSQGSLQDEFGHLLPMLGGAQRPVEH